jgi:hypothetical protein
MAPSKSQAAPKAPSPKAYKAPRSGAKAVPARKRVDWEAVERDFRTGQFTLRELETKHGPNNATISRRAAKYGWTQDLSIVIKQATNAMLIESLVTDECSKAQQNAATAVLAAAELNKDVILGHRNGLSRITRIKATLLTQIEQAAENMPDLTKLIESMRQPDDYGNDRANDALKRAMNRSALVDDLKKLADVDEKVRKGEREAFKLDDDPVDKVDHEAERYARMSMTERAARIALIMEKARKKAEEAGDVP